MVGDQKRLYQKAVFKVATLFFLAISISACSLALPRKPASDYSRLVELMRLEDRSTPVYAFNDFVKRFDHASHKTTLAYFNSRNDLIKKIRKDLGGKRLQWKLDDFEQRLLYVPETRQEYADLYENYCHAVVELDNPYTNIETLDHPNPEIPQNNGVAVFLVHNLAREYVETYSFFNENHQKEIKISMRGRTFIGEIGSYSSMLEVQDDGTVKFKRNRYTIWQNSAEMPYNALIVPIEETLHIALRQNTEAAIREQLRGLGKNSHRDVEQIVEHWISVEEAMVGGLVNIFFPQVVAKYLADFPQSEIDKSVHAKFSMKRYRYLQKGIQVVRNMGFKAAIGVYRRNPEIFRNMLVSGTDPSFSAALTTN
jgi:hypothetical protein